jgi:hypothetical protein
MLSINPLQAQKTGTRITNTEYLLVQDTIRISGRLTTKDKEPVSSSSVFLLAATNDEVAEITVSTTSNDGSFQFELDIGHSLISKSSTNQFIVRYPGNEEYAPSERNLEAKMVVLEVSVVMENDNAFIETGVFETTDSLQKVPVPEMDVYLYVKRLFGDLPIGETWTDEYGVDRIELPSIPGGKDGSIELIARLEDTDEYGNVETRLLSDQGHIVEAIGVPERELWTSKPPLWMLITFFGLMFAVWIHYLIVVIKLIAIRKNNKNLDINFETH